MPSLIASLEREGSERDESAAVGLVRFVKTYCFVACCKLLSKVLPHGCLFCSSVKILILQQSGLTWMLPFTLFSSTVSQTLKQNNSM